MAGIPASRPASERTARRWWCAAGIFAACGRRSLPLLDQIERGGERRAGLSTSITHQGPADGLDRHAVLQGDTSHDRGIAGVGVGIATCPMVAQEYFC